MQLLIIERKKNERIAIELPDGRLGVICITEIVSQAKVKVGLDIPRDCRVIRDDLWPKLAETDERYAQLLAL